VAVMQKKLTKQQFAMVRQLSAELETIIQHGREWLDTRSEATRNNDKNTDFAAWLDELEVAMDALDCVREAP
jgi:hypothetical protein